MNCNKVTLSPELNFSDLQQLATNSNIPTELIVYGRTPLMNSNYCLLGKSNKCYASCKHLCNSSEKFYLKDSSLVMYFGAGEITRNVIMTEIPYSEEFFKIKLN